MYMKQVNTVWVAGTGKGQVKQEGKNGRIDTHQ